MLRFTRTQATIILVTVLVICGLSVPNFVSDETFRSWPEWAQRRIALAPELEGGTSLLLEIDRNALREHVLYEVFREVGDVLRDAHIGFAKMAIRNGSVEVRPLSRDFEAALDKLGELSRVFSGVPEVTDAGGGLIRVIPTEAGLREYETPTVNQAIGDIRARLFGVPATAEREGAWRIRVQARRGPEVFVNW